MNMYDGKKPSRILKGILAFVLIVILSGLALLIGKISGDALYLYDKQIVGKFNVQSFKDLLSLSVPAIDIVYDTKEVVVGSELSNLIKSLFEFNLSSPVTIISSESAIFKNYYLKDYMNYLAGIGMEPPNGIGTLIINEPEGKDEIVPQDGKNKEDGKTPGEEIKENASSLYYEPEEKDPSKSNIIEGGNIQLCNETAYVITKADIENMLSEPLKKTFGGIGPQVLVYHTHTTESYLRSVDELELPVAAYTLDTGHSVVRVGAELARDLEENYGIDVLHNTTIHNYPDHYNAYASASVTIETYLKSYSSIKLGIDIHRDAIQKEKLRVVKDIEGAKAARIMFVVGTEEYGLMNPRWRENLKLAIKLQQSLNKQCPGLARHIYITPYRYNQHLADNSLLIEMGGNGNTAEECLRSVKYLSRAIDEVMIKNP